MACVKSARHIYTTKAEEKKYICSQFVDARYGQIYSASERMPRFLYAAIYTNVELEREKFKQVRAV